MRIGILTGFARLRSICLGSSFALAIGACGIVTPGLIADEKARPAPVPFIFDTDLGNDVDDALAMAMIHSLQSRGECELLAVTVTKDHELAGPFADVINTFYGRGNIPIGVCRSGVTPDKGKFNVLAEQRVGDAFRYPHDLTSGKNAPAALTVLRSTLAKANDQSVVIAQVGFSTNLVQLLASPGDNISPLTGVELIKKKVRLLSIMGGAFKKIPGPNGTMVEHREYNITQDIPAAKRLTEKWPTTIAWSGFEIGLALPYPHESIEMDYGYVKDHPISEAYRLYEPPPHNRPTWDLTSVLYAIRPNHHYFGTSKTGRVKVEDDGLTVFTEQDGGRDIYLTLSDNQQIRVTEALVQLSSQPPTVAPAK